MKEKCIVKGCHNSPDDGRFVGDICAPCYKIITKGKPESKSTNFIHKLYKKNLNKDPYDGMIVKYHKEPIVKDRLFKIIKMDNGYLMVDKELPADKVLNGPIGLIPFDKIEKMIEDKDIERVDI